MKKIISLIILLGFIGKILPLGSLGVSAFRGLLNASHFVAHQQPQQGAAVVNLGAVVDQTIEQLSFVTQIARDTAQFLNSIPYNRKMFQTTVVTGFTCGFGYFAKQVLTKQPIKIVPLLAVTGCGLLVGRMLAHFFIQRPRTS